MCIASVMVLFFLWNWNLAACSVFFPGEAGVVSFRCLDAIK